MITRIPIVLASASPRRKELLRRLVDSFEVDTADVDETAFADETPWQTAERLASAKAKVVLARHPGRLVIAGDTVVALPQGAGFIQLAKPADEQDAANMLALLSGKRHLVITGVCLLSDDKSELFSVTTEVFFRPLTSHEIEAYVATGEPMDKAGAYAIQGGAADFVEKYEGSLTNVIGFPVEEIEKRLKQTSRDLL